MTKFKLTKLESDFGGIRWLYRDFIIEDTRYSGSPYAYWGVFKQDVCFNPIKEKLVINRGKKVYCNGNGTRKEMIEWVDDYYKEMNDYTSKVLMDD